MFIVKDFSDKGKTKVNVKSQYHISQINNHLAAAML